MSSPDSSKSPGHHGAKSPLHSDIDEQDRSSDGGTGSDSENDAPAAGAVQPKARKVFDNLQFSQFLRDHQEKIYTSISTSTVREQDKSMHMLVQEAESEKIISSPREYQTELFERAKQKNIIAVLDTGAFA